MKLRLISALTLLFASACDSSTSPDPEIVPFLIQGAYLTPLSQRVEVSRPGHALTSVEVTVNGEELPQVSPGVFVGNLSSILTTGSTVTLVVRDGDVVATGTATLPAQPILLAPGDGTYIPDDEPAQFTWSSTGTPDRFEAALESLVGSTSFSQRTEVAGDATNAAVPITGAPSAPVDLSAVVYAFNDGSFSGAAHPDSKMGLRAESDQHFITLGEPPTPFLITGGDMSPLHQNVFLTRPGHSMAGVEVTVNGTSLTQNPAIPGLFNGVLPAMLDPGATLTLIARDGAVEATGTATVQATPVLVSPAQGASLSAGQPVNVVWTSANDPDEFRVSVNWVFEGSGYSSGTTVAGTVREAQISTAAIPPGATDTDVTVFSYRDGIFTGAVDPNSKLRLRASGGGHSITLVP